MILKTAVERGKDVQDIDVHSEDEKSVVTCWVMSLFSVSLGASRACADFRESTADSRMIHGLLSITSARILMAALQLRTTPPQSPAPSQLSSTKRSPEEADSTEKQSGSQELTATESRNQRTNQHNLDILEANRKASLSTPGQPLSLLFQTAIDAINAELSPTLGENAIERAQEEGLDTSPEATAERIVSLTMGSFGRFQEHRPELTEPEQFDRFFELISSGIEQGFAEAKNILDSLSVLEGSIAGNIAKTYELVQQGLEKYREQFSAGEDTDTKSSAA